MIRRWRKLALSVLGASVMMPFALQGQAFAGQGNQTFIALYEHNAQITAMLLSEARASNATSDNIKSMTDTITALNEQTANLYLSEQALANARLNQSKGSVQTSTDVAKLLQQQDQLKTTAIQESKDIRRNRQNGISDPLLQARHQVTQSLLRAVNLQLRRSEVEAAKPTSTDQLNVIQSCIYRLQGAAIDYLGAWMSLEKTDSGFGPAVSVTGLAYRQAKVTIPRTASGRVMDDIAAWPIAQDQVGNVLPVSGKFSLSGPVGASGVTVDPMTGKITVAPGATSGIYHINYTQNGITTHATVSLSDS